MSYCRFSSMNWKCDVYVYEDVYGGWTTHVANQRRRFPIVPDIMWNPISEWLHKWSGAYWDKELKEVVYPKPWRKKLTSPWFRFTSFWHNKIHMKMVSMVPLKPIGLPHDGKTFNHETPQECAEWLEELRSIGYNVPQYAINALYEENAIS